MEDYGEKTTASYTCSFGSADDSYAFRMMDLFKKSKVNFIACPTESAYLQGRHDTYPKRRGLTRVKEFMEKGEYLFKQKPVEYEVGLDLGVDY